MCHVAVWLCYLSQFFTPLCLHSFLRNLLCVPILTLHSVMWLDLANNVLANEMHEKNSWNWACTYFYPLLSPWEHVQASPLEDENHMEKSRIALVSQPRPSWTCWQPANHHTSEGAQRRPEEPPSWAQPKLANMPTHELNKCVFLYAMSCLLWNIIVAIDTWYTPLGDLSQ